MNKKGVSKRTIIAILIILVILIAGYFMFFFSYKCDSVACFQEHQRQCSKTKFTNDVVDAKWLYFIKGKTNGDCEVEVEVIQIKTGTTDKKILEGKTMTCYVPLGETYSPESDLSACEGKLKEELQELMINKLHKYIIENLGEIADELQMI